MSATARFTPELCPGCHEPVRAAYSMYARAKLHPLYVPLLSAIFVVGAVMILGSFWAVAQLTDALVGGQGLRRKERGVIYFAASAGVVVAIVAACVWAGRRLGRLPRRFQYECGTCRWTGPATVSERGVPAPAGGTVIEVDADGPLAVMRGQRARRAERERRQARADEEQGPNPDFDFGRGGE